MARQQFEVFEQPSVRVSAQWSPALLRNALARAEGGHLGRLAELCEALLGDDRIAGVFETRISGLLGLTPAFEESGDGRRRKRAVRALEVDEDWWEIAPEAELYQVLVWGRLLGAGPYQHAWIEHRGRLVPSIRFWHPAHVRFDWQKRQWSTRVSRDGQTGAFEELLEPGAGRWGLHTPNGAFRPWAHGLWRGLSRFWLLKQYALDDWGRLGESASRLVGTAPEGTTREQRKELAADLFDLARDATIVLPNGCDTKLIEASAATRELYEKQIQMADAAIAINVLGQNLTTEVKEGSFAAASIHSKVELQRIKADAQTASTTIHDQTLAWWAEFNFGDPELAPWPVWPTDPPDDNAKTVKVWVDFGAALQSFQTAGLRVDAIAMAEKVGLPLLKEAEPGDTDPGSKAEREAKAPDAGETDTPRVPAVRVPAEPGPSDGSAVKLASGDSPRLAAGFIEGQTYADALVDRGQQRGADRLAPFLAELDRLIAGVDSLEGARQQLIDFYEGSMSPEDLAEMSERLFLLALRAGAGAVQQDTPELDF
jgi:phage gp29-like protein